MCAPTGACDDGFMRYLQRLALALTLGAGAFAALPSRGLAQPVRGMCTTCGTDRANCGPCIADGAACFNALPVAERRPGVFQTADGRPASMLRFARLIKGAPTSASDINRAVGRQYNGGNVFLYYGDGMPPGFCAPAGGPPRAFMTDTEYRFGWDRRYEDTLNGLDCYNAEVDRFYIGVMGIADGTRVCDGEQAMFLPQHGAIFDLGGEGNRVAVFPFTDHDPLPCESFEFSVWLSNNPDAVEVAEAGRPDPNRWNPAVLTRAFLQGWIPDVQVGAQNVGPPLMPNLSNPSQKDGIVQVFALPCGLTFRYASIVAGNNGNPSPSCTFYSFDAELDAVAGLNEDDTAICPDRDGDGFRDRACGGNDCNDNDRAVNPAAVENCAATRDLNCDGSTPMCPSNTTCVNGLCAPTCVEGGCPEGQTCITPDAGGNSYCLPSPCATVTCPAGQVCGPTGCQDPCANARCPTGQVCRGGACVDPCVGVLCPMRQHCEAGRCVANCPCVACATGATCNSSTGRCDAPGCGMLQCPPGALVDCRGATARCVQPCEGVTCPIGARCEMSTGNCVRDPCAGITCPSNTACQEGRCVRVSRDGGVTDGSVTPRDGGGDLDAGSGQDASGMTDGGVVEELLVESPENPGCGCRTGSRARGGAALAGLALAALAGARRRRVTDGRRAAR